jgi:hypothetical protein
MVFDRNGGTQSIRAVYEGNEDFAGTTREEPASVAHTVNYEAVLETLTLASPLAVILD